jgi:4'-phosphopantetheinyl transferase
MASPEAAGALDSSTLVGSELADWMALRSPRRRLDWASSRALIRSACLGGERRLMSLSHSHGYAALATGAWPGRVGVDIEYLRDRDFVALANLAFARPEAEFIASRPQGELRAGVFYELWTLKEACAKALGLPLAAALQSCRFVDQDAGAFYWKPALPWDEPWRAVVFEPHPNLRLAVVHTDGQAPHSPIKTMNWPLQPVHWAVTAQFCATSASIRA